MQRRYGQYNFDSMDHDRFVIIFDKGFDNSFSFMDDATPVDAAVYAQLGASAIFFLPKGAFAVLDVLVKTSNLTDFPNFVFNYQVHNNSKLFVLARDVEAKLTKQIGNSIEVPAECLQGLPLSKSITALGVGKCSLECPSGSGVVQSLSGCNVTTQRPTCQNGQIMCVNNLVKDPPTR